MNKRDRTDKGFELIYWNLSYRRKFIRTLWLAPIVILMCLILAIKMPIFGSSVVTILGIAAIISTSVGQLIYTYHKWKKEKREKKESEADIV